MKNKMKMKLKKNNRTNSVNLKSKNCRSNHFTDIKISVPKIGEMNDNRIFFSQVKLFSEKKISFEISTYLFQTKRLFGK